MQKRLSIFIFIAVFASCWPASGAEQRDASKTTTPEIPPSSLINQKLENENTLLKEQNKVIKEFQGSILDTVYWALGGVFATAALLAGFGWLSNFKLYEADKQRMRQDWATNISELEAKLALRLENNRTELERAVDAKGETQLSRLLSELTDVRANISTLTNESHDRSDEIKAAKEDLESKIKAVNKTLLETSIDLRWVEEYVWDSRGVYANILITQCQAIDAAIDGENTNAISSILVRMKDTLEKRYIEKKETISKRVFDTVQDSLSKLSGNKIPVGEILELLGKITVTPGA